MSHTKQISTIYVICFSVVFPTVAHREAYNEGGEGKGKGSGAGRFIFSKW